MDISTLFTQAARKWPQALAIKDLRSARELTFAELDQALDDFAAGLVELGVGTGERVALLADTSLDYLLADYGCMAHGRVRVPLDPSLAPGELLAQIKDAGARLLLFGKGHAHVAAALVEQGVVCLPLDAVSARGMADAPLRVARARTELASLNYTGGTTGAPKAVMHTHASLCAVLQNIVMARAALPGDVLDLLGGIDTIAGGQIWSAIGTLSQPLFHGGQLKGQLHFDQAHVEELTASYRESIIEALQDVETQLSAARELDKSYTLNRAAVDSAREAARLAQVRYRLGSTDFQTLLIVERTQYQAEDSLLQVRLQQVQAAVGVFRALGGDFSAASQASQSPVQVAQP